MTEVEENTNPKVLAEVPTEVSETPAVPTKRPKGRPKKVLSNEEIEFKKQIAEETEKAYKEVIETKIKKNIKYF